MEKQIQIFDYIANSLGVTVAPQLPTEDGYALQIAPSASDTTFFNNFKTDNMVFLLLGKSKDQQALADSLYKICNTLNQKKLYSYDIYNIETNSPSLADIEGNFYIWQCQITVKFINN